MHRHFFPVLLILISTIPFLAACTAKVDEACVGGKCNPDGVPPELMPPPSDGGNGLIVCTAPAGPATGDIPCEVFEVIHRTCHACHIDPPAGGAPFPLLSYENTQAAYGPDRKIFQRMSEVIRRDGAPRMPLGGMLSPEDEKVLGDWLNLCAPPKDDGMGCECPAPGMGCN